MTDVVLGVITMGFKLRSDFPKQFQLVRFPRPRLGGYSQRFAVQRQDVVSVDEVLQRFIRRWCQLFRHSIYKICVVRVFLWCVCDKKKRDLFQSNSCVILALFFYYLLDDGFIIMDNVPGAMLLM